jgi:hypothetical protein
MLTEIKREQAKIGDTAFDFGKRKHVPIKTPAILTDVLTRPTKYSRVVFRRVKISAKLT